MRARSQGRIRSVDRRNYGPGYRAAKYPELQDADALTRRGRQHSVERKCELHRGPARSVTLARRDTSCTEVGRSRVHPRAASARGTHREVQGQEPMMNEHGKSDRPIVPGKSPNKARVSVAEEMEGRGLAKGNLGQQNAPRTQSRISAPSELAQIRSNKKMW